ncbi:5'-methylthioadenosine/S-adenosylhomocysteine nucleosidase [Janthinobacterium sp. HH104]|uniref:5'-methylthioadenosine/adenosylhomocysteine nucleosidase n=1 Tax=Janthinobacterium sp. HH104 TaxID=1537276 RepID=UPI00089337CF|nr:5'-methylthioadenosine/adenosylhomocysteine nucleosidase [Janthinobacterium sp. HH104]OEZ83926.1 5'-methylthioadenosine/S-adenosylhomocysteine nucleosidase [Janthinobacterium sp. HH104]
MQTHKKMRLGIISALHEEQQGLVEAMQGPQRHSHGMRDYTLGTLWNIDAVCVLSRLGKVAAAMTASILVEKYGVTHIVFTGVAGSGDKRVKVGDIVVAEALLQHDMDARPLFPRFEVPLTGLQRFATDLELSTQLAGAAEDFLRDDVSSVLKAADIAAFGLQHARVHRGLIASGDQFISSAAHLNQLKVDIPDLLAVEMEGAAVAQVCFELGVPFTVMRTISDNANEEAAVDFMRFVQTVASPYAYTVIQQLCQRLAG